MSHYKWLDKNLRPFLEALGVDWDKRFCDGLISAHGDKCYGYRANWEQAGLHFYHGVAIFLLTYLHPWCDEVRGTNDGWVDSGKWVVQNKDRFLQYLPPVVPEECELRKLLDPYDKLQLECDGLTRVLSYVLEREGISHKTMMGKIEINPEGFSKGERQDLYPHFWIMLDGGKIIDYRLRTWFGNFPSIPHGIFERPDNVVYKGNQTFITINDAIFKILTR